MRREITGYKALRDGLTDASGTLLTPQALLANGPAWDVFQTTPDGSRSITLWGFQSDRAVTHTIVRPLGLRADSLYVCVQSANHGSLGIISGASLMDDGVELVASPYSAADTVLLDRVRSR